MTNRRGPEILPWGTPWVTGNSSDNSFPQHVRWIKNQEWIKMTTFYHYFPFTIYYASVCAKTSTSITRQKHRCNTCNTSYWHNDGTSKDNLNFDNRTNDFPVFLRCFLKEFISRHRKNFWKFGRTLKAVETLACRLVLSNFHPYFYKSKKHGKCSPFLN